MLVIGRAHPRAADRYPPAAQRHRTVVVAVTLREPAGVVLALRTYDLGDLGFHQLVHDPETDSDAQRQQPLPRCTDELAQRLLVARNSSEYGGGGGVGIAPFCRARRRPGHAGP